MSHAHIGKIRLKTGGAEVRVLHQEPQNIGGENWRSEIVRAARIVAEHDKSDSALVGYLMVGLFSDGSSSIGYRWDKDRTPIPRALMPDYVAEIVRRDLITETEAERIACNVVNRANGYDPGDS